jgi:hypothetical protein
MDKLEQILPRVLMSYVFPANTTPRMRYIVFTLILFLAKRQMAKSKNTQTQKMTEYWQKNGHI